MDNMQLWLISSTDSINLNSGADGFYLNPDLDGLTGLPEIRSSNGVNGGYDGGWTSTQLWDARLITIRGLIVDKDGSVVEAKRKQLAKLVGQGKKDPLTLKFVSEAGHTYTCTVRTTNCTMALQNVYSRQEYQIQLRADDPLIYDDGGDDVQATLRVQTDSEGFEIPFDIPLDISGGADPVVVDAGEDANYPVITMYGELHSPTIVNQTTNQQLQLGADLDGSSLEWTESDTAAGNPITLTNDTDYDAPVLDFEMQGNTEQTTYSGKNLVVGSQDFSGTWTNSGHWTTSAETYNGLVVKQRKLSWQGLWGDASVETGKTYTFSFWAKAETNRTVKIYFQNTIASPASKNIDLTTSWQRFSATFTAIGDGNPRARIENDIDYDTYTSICGYQIEQNASMTAYEPYVGGTASPNPDYPQAVNTTTGENVVKITGKNLISSYIKNGNSVLFNGSNGYEDYIFKAGTYTLSYQDTNTCTTYMKTASSSNTNMGTGKTITFTATEPFNIWLYRSGITTEEISNLQLELGSTATNYEPYQGQEYEVNLGKNLLENTRITTPTTTNSVTATPNADGTISLSGTASALTWFVINNTMSVPAGTYTLSGGMGTGSGVAMYNDNWGGTEIAKTVTLTSKSTGNWSIRIASGTNTNGMVVKPQLERGATATTYATYFTPIELCKIGTYQDYIYKSGDDWYIHKETSSYIFDGSADEAWNISAGTYYSPVITDYALSNNIPVSEYFEGVSNVTGAGDMSSHEGCIAFINSYTWLRFYLRDTAVFDNNNPLTTWLTTHPLKVYYALATATDTEITNQALIDQLEAIVSTYLPQGAVNISLTGTGAQGSMVLEYGTGYIETPADVAVIDCKDRTVMLNGANAYNLLAEGSEFIRLAPGENKLYLTSESMSDSGYAEVKFKTGNLSI